MFLNTLQFLVLHISWYQPTVGMFYSHQTLFTKLKDWCFLFLERKCKQFFFSELTENLLSYNPSTVSWCQLLLVPMVYPLQFVTTLKDWGFLNILIFEQNLTFLIFCETLVLRPKYPGTLMYVYLTFTNCKINEIVHFRESTPELHINSSAIVSEAEAWEPWLACDMWLGASASTILVILLISSITPCTKTNHNHPICGEKRHFLVIIPSNWHSWCIEIMNVAMQTFFGTVSKLDYL